MGDAEAEYYAEQAQHLRRRVTRELRDAPSGVQRMPSARTCASLATPSSDGRGFRRRQRTDKPDADRQGRNSAPGLSSSRLMLPSQSLNTPPASMPSSPS